MQAEPPLQGFKILRVLGQFGEEPHLDGAEQAPWKPRIRYRPARYGLAVVRS